MKTIHATREQVAAAMIAVVAERGRDYNAETSALWDGQGNSCIQGAMLQKLGYPFKKGAPVGGNAITVMDMLGQKRLEPKGDNCPCGCQTFVSASYTWEDSTLFDALRVAQYANDSCLGWGAALDGFEDVLASRETVAAVFARLRPSTVHAQHWESVSKSIASMKAYNQKLTEAMVETQAAAKAAAVALQGVTTSYTWTDEFSVSGQGWKDEVASYVLKQPVTLKWDYTPTLSPVGEKTLQFA